MVFFRLQTIFHQRACQLRMATTPMVDQVSPVLPGEHASRILLIDADPLGADTTIDLLCRAGHRVYRADPHHLLPELPAPAAVILRLGVDVADDPALIQRLHQRWEPPTDPSADPIPWIGLLTSPGQSAPTGLAAYLPVAEQRFLVPLLAFCLEHPRVRLPHRGLMGLDERVLENLEDGVDRSSLGNIIGLFLRDTEQRLARMHDAHAHRDWPALAREAHGLKSAAATFGLVGPWVCAQQLERVSRQTEITRIGEHLDMLMELLPPALAALGQRYRNLC